MRWHAQAGSTTRRNTRLIQEQVEKLESFTSALADGVVSKQELARPGAAAGGGDEDARAAS